MVERDLDSAEGLRSFLAEKDNFYRSTFAISGDFTPQEVALYVENQEGFFKPDTMEGEHDEFIVYALFVRVLNAFGDPGQKMGEEELMSTALDLMFLHYDPPEFRLRFE